MDTGQVIGCHVRHPENDASDCQARRRSRVNGASIETQADPRLRLEERLGRLHA